MGEQQKTMHEKKPFLGMAGKDYITISISIFAFLISATVAYYNTLRQIDFVSLTVVSENMSFKREGKMISIASGSATTVLINNGNRNAAILSMGIRFVQSAPNDEPTLCEFGMVRPFESSFVPTVLKEKEIVTTTAALVRNAEIEVAPWNLPKDGFRITTCLDFLISTPSVSNHRISVPIALYPVLGEGGLGDRSALYGRPDDRPIVLVRRAGSIFSP